MTPTSKDQRAPPEHICGTCADFVTSADALSGACEWHKKHLPSAHATAGDGPAYPTMANRGGDCATWSHRIGFDELAPEIRLGVPAKGS